jgi:excisionase family DNA binding protein
MPQVAELRQAAADAAPLTDFHPGAILPFVEVLSTAEAARRLGVSQSTMLRLARSGAIPCAKLSGRTGGWVFDADVIAVYAPVAAGRGRRGPSRARPARDGGRSTTSRPPSSIPPPRGARP